MQENPNPQVPPQEQGAVGVAPVVAGGSKNSDMITWALIAGYAAYAAKEGGWLIATKFLAPEHYFSFDFKEFILDGLELSIITYLFLGFMMSPLSAWLKGNAKLNTFWKKAALLPAVLGLLVLISYPIGFMGSLGVLVAIAAYSTLYGKLLEKGVGKYFQ